MFDMGIFRVRFLVVACFLSPFTGALAADVNLDAARNGYNKTLSRIHSLWSVTRRDLTPLRENVLPVVDRRIEWAYDGKKQYSFWQNGAGHGDSTRIIRWSSDGKEFWTSFHSEYEPYNLLAIFHGPVETLEYPEFYREDGVAQILGYGFGIGGPGGVLSIHSLTTLLNTSDAAFLDFEEIGGSKCYKVRAGYLVFGPKDDRVEITVWFDPAMDWWPRKIQSNGYGTSDIEVSAFQRVPLGLGPESLAFPQLATLTVPDAWKVQFAVQEVRLNQPIDPSVFTPKVPKGVELISSENEAAGQDFLRRYTEQSPNLKQLRAESEVSLTSMKQTDIPAGLESHIDARPTAPVGWPAILILGALMFLAAASFLALRVRAA